MTSTDQSTSNDEGKGKKTSSHRTFLTQAPWVDEPKTPSVVQFTTFASSTVQRLSTDSFNVDTDSLITLKYNDCFIVLFHVENSESHRLMKIFSVVAEQTPGPMFGAINVLLEHRVAEAFAKVRMHGSHPFRAYSLKQWPVIIAYRKGYPSAVYNGARETGSLAEWSLTMACDPAFSEPIQISAGMQTESRIEMSSPGVYGKFGKTDNRRKSSLDYQSDKSIRDFDPKLPLVATGSKAAKSGTEAVRQKDAEEEGVNLTPEQISSGIKSDPTLKTAGDLKDDVNLSDLNSVGAPEPGQVESPGSDNDEDELPGIDGLGDGAGQ